MTCRPSNPSRAAPRRYLIGNAVTIRARLTEYDGTVVDPENLRLRHSGPGDSTSITVDMTVEGDDAVGSFTPDRAGLWWYRVETFQGAVSAAAEHAVVVVETALPAP